MAAVPSGVAKLNDRGSVVVGCPTCFTPACTPLPLHVCSSPAHACDDHGEENACFRMSYACERAEEGEGEEVPPQLLMPVTITRTTRRGQGPAIKCHAGRRRQQDLENAWHRPFCVSYDGGYSTPALVVLAPYGPLALPKRA